MARWARGWSRRHFLGAGLAASGLYAEGAKGTQYSSDWRRYPDPATELTVLRLTDPAYASRLGPYYNASIPRRGAFLLFTSDRTGTTQAFRMDLKSGECTQLTDAAKLDPETLALLADGRSFLYFDDRALRLTNLQTLREREVYAVPSDRERGLGVSVTPDGGSVLLVESQAAKWRLRSVSLGPRGGERTVVEAPFAMSHPIANPSRAQVLYRYGDQALWVVNSDGRQNRKLALAAGRIGPANWNPDGRTVLYLRFPEDRVQLNEIREYSADGNTDKLVAKTSQFVHFGFNRDSSVFVGASRNAASPNVLLLLRLTRREFTLCEHRSSAIDTVAPIFSPDAQHIYFQSDRHGKPAIYSMNVDKLVERIEAES